MKILKIFNGRGWEAETSYMYTVSMLLNECGHEVTILGPEKTYIRQIIKEDHPIKYIPDKNLNKKHNLFLQMRFVFSLRKHLKSNKYDIVHIYRSQIHIPTVIAVKTLRKIPIIRTRGFARPIRNNLFNKLIYSKKLTDFNIVPSFNSIQNTEERGFNTENFRVIYMPLDRNFLDYKYDMNEKTEELRNKHDLHNKIIIGIAARLAEVKGHKYIIQAAEELVKEYDNIKFIFAGWESDSAEDVKMLITEKNLNEHIVLTGRVKDMKPYINLFDIALICSIGSEENSRAALEYMFFEKPIIGTKIGIIPEIIEDNQTGFLIDSKNSSQISEKIKYLIDRPDKRKEFGLNGKKRLSEHISDKVMVEKTLKIYKEVLSEAK